MARNSRKLNKRSSEPPKQNATHAQRSMSRAVRERAMRVVQSFYLYNKEGHEMVPFLRERIRTFDEMKEERQKELRGLIRFMSAANIERDKTWWPLPEWGQQLRFFDGPDGVRNVPLVKKRVRA